MANLPEEPHILAVDLGTSGCKTALVSLGGSVTAWAFRAVKLHILPGDGVEQVPEDWWHALVATTREVLDAAHVRPECILAICCSCQGEGTVPVDVKGRPLANAVLWQDMRGAGHIRHQARGVLNVTGYGALKLARWVRLTGGAPSLSGKDPAAHMLYFREEQPEIYRSTHKFLGVLDYMNLRLTGRVVATYDSILTSWVTDNRNPGCIRYNDNLLEASGIEPDKFPDLVPCTEVLGTLTTSAAEQLGLLPATKVVAGSVDVSAAALGSGAVADGAPHLYVGTSSWIGAHVPWKKTDIFSQIASVPCAVPGRYMMISMQSTAGGSLEFLRDRILHHRDALQNGTPPSDFFSRLDRVAANVPPGSRGLLYMPWLTGERAPVADANLRAGFFNLRLEHSREEVVRAMMEGVALNTRWMVPSVERFLGRRMEEITIVGGGATSDTWCGIFADVLGVRVRQVCDPVQVNAVGAARIATLGLGLSTLDGIARQTRIRRTYQPEEANKAAYSKSFRIFLELHRKLAPVYSGLNRD